MSTLQENKVECKNDDKKSNVIQGVKMLSGHDLPIFAYGTSWRHGINAYWGGYQEKIWQRNLSSAHKSEEEKLEQCIVNAIKHGYKCIDTAQGYTTEHIIGNILSNKQKYGTLRSDIFITTKLGSKERTIERCKQSIARSLELLQTDYIDLYLIHSPHTNNDGMDVIKIYKYLLTHYKSKGIIRSLGVSNFNIEHIECLRKYNFELPSVNQIAFSCFFNPHELIKYCNEHSIIVQGYSPLCKASKIVTSNQRLLKIASKYNKKWSDVCLKYCAQKNVPIVCQSKNSDRIKQNIDVYFDGTFKISGEDMRELDKLNKIKLRLSWGSNPLDIKWKV